MYPPLSFLPEFNDKFLLQVLGMDLDLLEREKVALVKNIVRLWVATYLENSLHVGIYK
jgi:hypothetical protein